MYMATVTLSKNQKRKPGNLSTMTLLLVIRVLIRELEAFVSKRYNNSATIQRQQKQKSFWGRMHITL